MRGQTVVGADDVCPLDAFGVGPLKPAGAPAWPLGRRLLGATRRGLATAALLLAACIAANAAAQRVYRCGPDGRIYSQTPCKDGYEVDAADQRSAEQRRAAAANVKREEKLTEKMARERRANEAAAAKQGASLIANPAAAKPAVSAASAVAAKKNPAKKAAGIKRDKKP